MIKVGDPYEVFFHGNTPTVTLEPDGQHFIVHDDYVTWYIGGYKAYQWPMSQVRCIGYKLPDSVNSNKESLAPAWKTYWRINQTLLVNKHMIVRVKFTKTFENYDQTQILIYTVEDWKKLNVVEGYHSKGDMLLDPCFKSVGICPVARLKDSPANWKVATETAVALGNS